MRRFPPDDPREWLRRARSNLSQARHGRDYPDICLEDLCHQCQQAVEKALKAILLALNVRFPYTHNVGVLLSLIEEAGQAVPPEARRSAGLSDYAVQARYPGLTEPVSEQEYADALALASAVVSWAEQLIAARQAEA